MAEPEQNELYYTSRYRHGVDEKRRVQIPAKWRTGTETNYMLAVWPDANEPKCLLVLPPKATKAFVEKITNTPLGDAKAEALRQTLGEYSDMATCDKAGRITLPEEMAKLVGIESEAILIGIFDRFQIWNPARFQATRATAAALAPEAFKQMV